MRDVRTKRSGSAEFVANNHSDEQWASSLPLQVFLSHSLSLSVLINIASSPLASEPDAHILEAAAIKFDSLFRARAIPLLHLQPFHC